MKKEILKLMTILMSVMLLSGCSISINNDNNIDNKNNENEQTEKTELGEDISVDSPVVMELMNKVGIFNNSWLPDNLEGYFYKSDKYTVDTMLDEVKLNLALYQIPYDHINFDCDDDVSKNRYEIGSISKETVENYYNYFFGPGAFKNIKTLNLEINMFTTHYEYDSANEEYKVFELYGFGGTMYPVYENKVISAKKYDDKLVIEEKVAYVAWSEETGKAVRYVYKSANGELLGKYNDEDAIAQYYDQLDTYRYTFKIAEDGMRYFYSVEKVK